MSNALIRMSMILARAMHLLHEAERNGPYEIRAEFPVHSTDLTLPMDEFDRTILRPAIDKAMQDKQPISDRKWVKVERADHEIINDEPDAFPGVSGQIVRFYSISTDEMLVRIDIRVKP